MALVVGPTDKENRERFSEFLLEQQKQLTELRGRNGASIFAVADYLLGELENLSLPSRPLRESELADALGPRGLAAYERMKAVSPEVFSFDGKLPAHGTRTVKLIFHEWHLSEVEEILGQRTDQRLPIQGIFALDGDEWRPLLKVEVEILTSECEAVQQELRDRRVVGASPFSRLILGRDPDR